MKPTALLLAGTALLLGGCGQSEKDPARQRYIVNALESRSALNNHPIQRFVSFLLVHRTSVSDFRHVPYSCSSGTDATLSKMTDIVATVTDYAFGFIPVSRYETSCAGLFITRGRIRPGRAPEPACESAKVPMPPPPPSPPEGR